MGISGWRNESNSVPNPASPMISRVVLLSHSKTSIRLFWTFWCAISCSQRLDSSSDLRQNTGESALIDEMENAGASAFR